MKNRRTVREAEKLKSDFTNAKARWTQVKTALNEKISNLKEKKKASLTEASEFKKKHHKIENELKAANVKVHAQELTISNLTNAKALLQNKCENAPERLRKAEEELKKFQNEEFGIISRQNKREEAQQYKATQQSQRNDQRTTQLARASGSVGGFQSGSSMPLPTIQVRK